MHLINPYAPAVTANDGSSAHPPRFPVLALMLTAATAVALMLAAWVSIVGTLDRRISGYDELLWAGSLWFSTLGSTLVVAYLRPSTHPAIGCTLAFALFGIAFMICEGDVSHGSDPVGFRIVIWNLICLPFGACAGAIAGGRLRDLDAGRYRGEPGVPR